MDNSTVSNSFAESCPNDAVCLLEVTTVIAVTFLILLSNTGNLIVLLSTPSFRNSHGYLLISLSVADLGVGANAALSIFPASATFRSTADSWPYGNTVCFISAYLGQVFEANSGYALLLLSLERYIAVAHPLKYGRTVTKKTTLICIALGWMLTLVIMATIFTGFPRHGYFPEIHSCQPVLTDNPLFVVLYFFLLLASMIVIIVTSVRISKKLKENARRRAAMTPAITPPSASPESGAASEGTSSRSIKLFRMVRIMTIAILICWFPEVSRVTIRGLFNVHVAQVIAFILFWLWRSNSFINTIIYYIMNKKFRDRALELVDALESKCCQKIGDLEKNLDCTCCFRTRSTDTYRATSEENSKVKRSSPAHGMPGTDNVELVKVKTEQVTDSVNEGFQKIDAC